MIVIDSDKKQLLNAYYISSTIMLMWLWVKTLAANEP
jgi:hypothetical protein